MIRSLILTITFCTLSLALIADDPKQTELAKKPMYERLLTGDDAKKALKLMKRIADLEATDDLESAIESQKELMVFRKRLQGLDHHEFKTEQFYLSKFEALSRLNSKERRNYRQVTGRWREARRHHSQAEYAKAVAILQAILNINRIVLKEDHPETAQCYNNLAVSLEAQGKAAEAEALFQKALVIYRNTLGEEHPDTAASYSGLAVSLDAQGRAAEAEPLFQKALVIYSGILGEIHPDTVTSYNNLAASLDAQGKVAEARLLFRKALEIRRQVHGEEHIDTVTSYGNLAYNLNAQGLAAEAEPLFQKALTIRRNLLGDYHPSTAVSYNNLASNMSALGRSAEAEPLYLKALEISRKVLGELHPDTANFYNGLAYNLNAQGKTFEAGPLFQKALAIRRQMLGDNHYLTAQSYNNVAANLDALGKATEAVWYHNKGLENLRKLRGEDHPDTAKSYNNLAISMQTQGKTVEAGQLFHKALSIHSKLFGENHPATANSYNNVAYNLDLQGKTIVAETLHYKALVINRKVYGEDNTQTAISYNNLATNLHAQGKAAEAEAILRKAIFSSEASRLSRAKGIERAIGEQFNPRLLLAAIECGTKPALAWGQVEMTLARGLLDQQGTSSLTVAEQTDQTSLRDRVTDLQSQILVLVSKPKRSADEDTRLEGLIRDRQEVGEKLAKLAVAESERAVAGREEIQAAIPPDSALLFWVDVSATSGVEEHFACVVHSMGEPKWERLIGTGADGKWTKEDNELPEVIRLTMKAISASPTELENLLDSLSHRPEIVKVIRECLRSTDALEKLYLRLHTQRIAPVLKHIDGVKTLYVVGVNQMAGIPVSLLTDQFAISYVPSGTFLARLKDQPKATGTQFLALGDAIYEIEKVKIKTSTDLPPGGILITQVIPMSAADKAGLQVGDVILKYGDAEIAKLEDLQKASASTKAEKVSLTIWREGRPKPFTTDIAAGRMGVVLDREPAPVAIANRRKTEAMLASIRGGEWTDLPGTRVETNRLKHLFGDHAKVFTDGNASEQTLESLRKSGELSKYRYLHLATHGEGNNVKAFESSLILSQDNLPKELMPKAGEPFLNGQLSAREVLDYWKLNAELVTLSACETAIGKQGGGDGLLGFAQAFLTAGARSVCLSLWKVDDTATALLMSRFYENLLGKREGLSKPMGKAAALDEAKRWLRGLSQEEALKLSAKISGGVDRGSRGKGVKVYVLPKVEKDEKPFAHPKYWAAFVLIGEP